MLKSISVTAVSQKYVNLNHELAFKCNHFILFKSQIRLLDTSKTRILFFKNLHNAWKKLQVYEGSKTGHELWKANKVNKVICCPAILTHRIVKGFFLCGVAKNFVNSSLVNGHSFYQLPAQSRVSQISSVCSHSTYCVILLNLLVIKGTN